jgi:type VI secretion system Hcp family effector
LIVKSNTTREKQTMKTKKLLLPALLLALSLLFYPVTTRAETQTPPQINAFLKIDGIPGESTDDKHKDWIDIYASFFLDGITQPTAGSASTSGGATAERANFSDVKIIKYLDKSTPKLHLACADGTHIKQVIIEFVGDDYKFYEVKLSNCIVSKVSTGGLDQKIG